jgi:hypothetical protein
MRRKAVAQQLRILDRRAADDRPAYTALQGFVDEPARAQAAAQLDPDALLRRHLPDQLAVARCSIAGAVQVHQVQPPHARVGVTHEQLTRIHFVDRLGVEFALEQAHALAAAQINGGNQQHGYSRAMKLASRRAPAAAERSG